MTENVADAVEAGIAELSSRLTEPGERECLRCFLLRMLAEFGCDNTCRWSTRWRDLRSPEAKGLIRRLGRLGGCCDCEVIFNVYPYYPEACAAAVRRSAAGRFLGALRSDQAAPDRLTGPGGLSPLSR